MKRIRSLSVALALAVCSSPSWAVLIVDGPYDGIDPGAVDLLLAQGAQQGNPTKETNWVNSVLAGLGINVEYQIKDDPVPFYATTDENIFAFFMADPASDYFLIKNATRIALFQNLAALNFGVFDITQLHAGLNLPGDPDEYEISHVTRFVSNSVKVSEPGALLLLGAGLLSLGFARRRLLA